MDKKIEVTIYSRKGCAECDGFAKHLFKDCIVTVKYIDNQEVMEELNDLYEGNCDLPVLVIGGRLFVRPQRTMMKDYLLEPLK